jgi:hypothetical protein
MAPRIIQVIRSYSGKLSELRVGRNNFSFRTHEELDFRQLASLFAEAEQISSIRIFVVVFSPMEAQKRCESVIFGPHRGLKH